MQEAVERALPATNADHRRRFDEQGFVTISGALSPDQLDELRHATERVYLGERARGEVHPDGSLHMFAFVPRDEAFLCLLDHPATFPLVCGVLGWNIHLYHSHLDVHPPVRAPTPPAWGWHQDGGRQNVELETEPRPRLSVKVAFWLSDVSEPGRGNLWVIPGSHLRNTLPRPDRSDLGFDQPDGAVPILARPGDAVVFDRRLWHTRTANRSEILRRALFLAYTYRWIRPRDDDGVDRRGHWLPGLSPTHRQLLGEGSDAVSFWGLGADTPPLRDRMHRSGLLDPAAQGHR